MPQRTVTVGSSAGLHARPASLIVAAVNDTGFSITIGRPGQEPVDASSILGLMALGIGHGESVEVSSDDNAAEDAVSAIADLVQRDLDAQDL